MVMATGKGWSAFCHNSVRNFTFTLWKGYPGYVLFRYGRRRVPLNSGAARAPLVQHLPMVAVTALSTLDRAFFRCRTSFGAYGWNMYITICIMKLLVAAGTAPANLSDIKCLRGDDSSLRAAQKACDTVGKDPLMVCEATHSSDGKLWTFVRWSL
jgi:hypothetical protein